MIQESEQLDQNGVYVLNILVITNDSHLLISLIYCFYFPYTNLNTTCYYILTRYFILCRLTEQKNDQQINKKIMLMRIMDRLSINRKNKQLQKPDKYSRRRPFNNQLNKNLITCFYGSNYIKLTVKYQKSQEYKNVSLFELSTSQILIIDKQKLI
ncbi:hypothetical protein pb186bvf_020957 [Paramecium bursaria]